MKKITIAAVCLLMICTFAGCGAIGDVASKLPSSSKEEYKVGEDITDEDINEFYYTIENINYDAYYLRYMLSSEDGKHMFFFEERERPDDYGPATEEDTIAKGEFELSDKEWSKFYEIISGGTVQVRDDDPVSGDSGPWTYLYWSGDEDKYQQYSFKSQSSQKEFEKLCEKLFKKSGKDVKSEDDKKNASDDVSEVFKKYFEEYYEVASEKESFVTQRKDDGDYFTRYPEELFGAIDYYIGDLDDDGNDEMLIIGLDEDDDVEYLWLVVYEYENDEVVLADNFETGEKVLEADGGNTFVFLYRDSNYPVIGIMTEDYYYTRADGMNIIFKALNYGDGEFTVAASEDYAGSDMEDNGLSKELRRNGIDISWDDLFEDDVQDRVLKACDGQLLAEYNIVLDDQEDEDYMPVKLYRHVETKGYCNIGLDSKGVDKKNWKSLEGAEGSEDENADDEYIFPDSSERLLTEADLRGMSDEELRRARNEIAARHGRKFADESLQKYFESKTWYEGTVDADEFNKKVRLNDIELKNMDFIKEHEK